MKENRGDTGKKGVTHSKPDCKKAEMKMADREKPSSMRNPVKGLTLSLYRMIKEH